MQPAEPTLAALPNAVQRYFLATRPAFLSVTLFSSLIGLGTAHASGIAIAWPTALVTLVFALLAHAGVNVLNDYYDALNGTDEMNTERVFPYTGGSRFIQNGVLTAAQTLRFGVALFAAVMLAGIWLAAVSGSGLLVIGLAGLVIGWGYSAAPLKLNSCGAGELCVMAGFALIVIGTDYVQRHAFATMPVVASVSYALLVTNVLYMNQFPDRKADAAAGKRHWVVRLAPEQARWGYVMIALAANAWLIGAVLAGALPVLALIALAAAIPSAQAAVDLFRYATQPRALTAAIRRTIVAALLHGLLLAGALFLSSV
ncbi:MAG: prenyltransferase [Sulfuricaulis sp.]|uniref:prenyltransferase n=1 Tax=Sulfuricaulis sp. TaxID=2003553 RepID=UPI0034A1533D